jgi:hypothetical protein
MALQRRKILKEMMNLGYGTTTVPDDSGGTRTGNKIGIHSFMGSAYLSAADMSGANAGAKIAYAMTQLPSTGGVVDARSFSGTQTIEQNMWAGATGPVYLMLGPGTWTLALAQTLTSTHAGSCIVGMGRGQSILSISGNINGIVLGADVQRMLLSGFRMVGNSTTGMGVVFDEAYENIMENVTISGCNRNLVFKDSGSVSGSAFSNTVRDCIVISATGSDAINIDLQANSHDTRLYGVTFGGGPAKVGIKCVDSTDLKVFGGDCEGVSVNAIYLDSSTSALYGGHTIMGVHFEGNTSTGGDIKIGATNAQHNVNIVGNYFHAAASNTYPVNIVTGNNIHMESNVVGSGYFTSSYPYLGTTNGITSQNNRWGDPGVDGYWSYQVGSKLRIGGDGTTPPSTTLEVLSDDGVTISRNVNSTGSGMPLKFRQKNASNTYKDFAQIYQRATSVTAGAEMGQLLFDLIISGAMTNVLDVNRVDIQSKRYTRFVTGTPSISGTGTLNTGSSDMAGKVTSNTTGAFDVTLTFSQGSWTYAPACVASNETTVANLVSCTSTTTTVRLRGTTVNNDVISYVCIGY